MSDNFMNRPKLKIPKTISEWISDIVGYSIFIVTIILLIVNWSSLPDKVPGHYNLAGEVTRWGSKFELLISPIITLVIVISVQTLEHFPHVHNYPERLSASNAKQFYLASRQLANQMKTLIIILFSLLLINDLSLSLEWGYQFGIFFTILLFVSLSIPIVVCIIRFRNIK